MSQYNILSLRATHIPLHTCNVSFQDKKIAKLDITIIYNPNKIPANNALLFALWSYIYLILHCPSLELAQCTSSLYYGAHILSILICKKMCNIKIFINWQFIGAKAEVYISFAFSRHQLLFEYIYKSVILNNKIFLTLLLHEFVH